MAGRSKEDGHSVADAFASEARAVNEAYLLQRDIHIIREGTVKQKLIGAILGGLASLFFDKLTTPQILNLVALYNK